MRIGIVGYQGSGKSSLFHWLTGEEPDPSLAHSNQMAMATVPEPRIDPLVDIYKPKKITRAAMEIVDTSGLSRSHEGNAQRLAQIREAGCMIMVVAAFGGNDAAADLQNFEDDLLMADLHIVANRIERLEESIKKPRPNRDEQVKELESLRPIHETLEAGDPLRGMDLSVDQQAAIKAFQLFTDKPRLVIVNSSDDELDPAGYRKLVEDEDSLEAFPVSLQVELMLLDPAERDEFCAEMEVAPYERDSLLEKILERSGQMLFFTAGEKEVRTWMIRQGGTAVEAAGNIHTDLARGFIRAETMNCEDLFRLGSEREVKAANLMRKEHREYVIQDGDIINIQHN